MNEDISLKNYFLGEELEKAEKIIKKFHDRLILDSRINNPPAILLSAYMVSNKNKKGIINKKEVKELFISLGRKSEEFDKAFYEISGKRKGKRKLIDLEGDNLGLNFEGLEMIKKLLGKNEKK